MKFTFFHNNINVLDLDKSVEFYKKALGLEVTKEFHADDMDAALALHKEMDCVCFENPDMGIYFINDPDGYWVEICPQ